MRTLPMYFECFSALNLQLGFMGVWTSHLLLNWYCVTHGAQVPDILGCCAPEVWQQITCPHKVGRADLGPARVSCSSKVGVNTLCTACCMCACLHMSEVGLPYLLRAVVQEFDNLKAQVNLRHTVTGR